MFLPPPTWPLWVIFDHLRAGRGSSAQPDERKYRAQSGSSASGRCRRQDPSERPAADVNSPHLCELESTPTRPLFRPFATLLTLCLATAVSYNKIGDVPVARGNLPEALKSCRGELAITERLAQADVSECHHGVLRADFIGDVRSLLAPRSRPPCLSSTSLPQLLCLNFSVLNRARSLEPELLTQTDARSRLPAVAERSLACSPAVRQLRHLRSQRLPGCRDFADCRVAPQPARSHATLA
jgi:hypothetical protein